MYISEESGKANSKNELRKVWNVNAGHNRGKECKPPFLSPNIKKGAGIRLP